MLEFVIVNAVPVSPRVVFSLPLLSPGFLTALALLISLYHSFAPMLHTMLLFHFFWICIGANVQVVGLGTAGVTAVCAHLVCRDVIDSSQLLRHRFDRFRT